MDFSEFRRTHEICGGSSPEVSGLNISSNILVFVFYLLYRYLVSENNNKDDNKAHYVLRKRAQKNVFPVGQTKAARFWKIPVATDHGEVSCLLCFSFKIEISTFVKNSNDEIFGTVTE